MTRPAEVRVLIVAPIRGNQTRGEPRGTGR
jgi:hypothetical protein